MSERSTIDRLKNTVGIVSVLCPVAIFALNIMQGNAGDPATWEPMVKLFPQPAAASTSQRELEFAAWQLLGTNPSAQDLEAFLKEFPNGALAPFATAKLAKLRQPQKDVSTIAPVQPAPAARVASGLSPSTQHVPDSTDNTASQELSAWDSLGHSPTEEELEAFLQTFPHGKYAAMARAKLHALRQPARTEGTPSSSTAAPSVQSPPPVATIGASLWAAPPSFDGSCPVVIAFAGKIKSNVKGEVRYRFARSDGAPAPERTLYFSEPGEQSVSTAWTYGGRRAAPSYRGWMILEILSPTQVTSNSAAFTVNCH